jgi:2-keto-4-pentenoate hydratase
MSISPALAPALIDVSRTLIAARRGATALDDFPAPVPATLAEAYGVQHAVLQGIGGPVLGWKIGRIPAAQIERLGTQRLAGPILSIA